MIEDDEEDVVSDAAAAADVGGCRGEGMGWLVTCSCLVHAGQDLQVYSIADKRWSSGSVTTNGVAPALSSHHLALGPNGYFYVFGREKVVAASKRGRFMLCDCVIECECAYGL